MNETWEPAERVQKNSAGEYRALMGGEWVPVAKAQKSSQGAYRVLREEGEVSAPPAAPQERSLGEQASRDFQLTGRAAITPFGGDGLADMLGMAAPEDAAEKMRSAVASGVLGNLGVMGVAGKLAPMASGAGQQILKLLAANPALQSTFAGLSSVAGEATKQAGGNELAQFGASMTAPVTASPLLGLGKHGTRRVGEVLGAMLPSGRNAAAGRVATDVAGPRAASVATAMQQGAPIETASQAAVPAGSAEFAGLEHLVRSRLPSDYNQVGTIPKAAANWREGKLSALRAATDPVRDQVLAQADATGLGVAPLSMEVARLRTVPGFKDKTSDYILNWLDKEIVRRADRGTAEIAGVDLYGLRKDLGLEIGKRVNDPKKPWNKETGARLLREFQLAIDYEIEKAAGSGDWTTKYLQPYSKGKAELGQIAKNAEDAEIMGAAGMQAARRISHTDEVPLTLPNLLSRPMMIVNAALKRTQGYGGEKTTETLADLMRPENKGTLAKLMQDELARRKLRMPAMESLRQAGRTGAVVGGMED